MAIARSTGGMSTYPWAAPPARVVRTEEAISLFRAEKGALQNLVTSSCTSGKKGTGGGCRRSAYAPRNQSSSLERSGEGGGLQCSLRLSAAQESIAVSSGSDSGNTTLPFKPCASISAEEECHISLEGHAGKYCKVNVLTPVLTTQINLALIKASTFTYLHKPCFQPKCWQNFHVWVNYCFKQMCNPEIKL